MFELKLLNPSKILSVDLISTRDRGHLSWYRHSVRLQLGEHTSSVPLNVTLFAGTTSTLGKHIATSGTYSDAMPGVVTPQTSLAAGTYLLVPSTFRQGTEARFRIAVFSTASGISLSRKK
jgi:calpain-7